MRCFYCGKRETYRNPFYNLDKDGHKICQSCMREGYTKSALENAFWVLEKSGCKVNFNGTIQRKNLFQFMNVVGKGGER